MILNPLAERMTLGEMFNNLASKGIRVPGGFATTAFAFKKFLQHNKVEERLKQLMGSLHKKNYSNLDEVRGKARALMLTCH